MRKTPSKMHVGFCIYCGRDGISDEHWLPKWLGGVDILVKGSCKPCQDRINKYIENPNSRGPFWSARKYLAFRSQSNSQDPLPMILYKNGVEHRVKISLNDNPALLMLFSLSEPSIFSVAEKFVKQGRRDVNFVVLEFDSNKKMEFERRHPCDYYSLGNVEYMPLSKLLAKIALGFAVAELGFESFRPLIRNFILHGDRAEAEFYVGGTPGMGPKRGSFEYAHFFQEKWMQIRGKNYLVVDVQLFAFGEMPLYSVVVGEEAKWESDYDTAKSWGISEQKLQRLRGFRDK